MKHHRVHLGVRGPGAGAMGGIMGAACGEKRFKSAFRNEKQPESMREAVTCKKCLRYLGCSTP